MMGRMMRLGYSGPRCRLLTAAIMSASCSVAITPPVLELRLALAFAAEDTDRDPGPITVLADDLGLLSVLAAGLTREDQHLPDVQALERAATTAPWALRTLD